MHPTTLHSKSIALKDIGRVIVIPTQQTIWLCEACQTAFHFCMFKLVYRIIAAECRCFYPSWQWFSIGPGIDSHIRIKTESKNYSVFKNTLFEYSSRSWKDHVFNLLCEHKFTNLSLYRMQTGNICSQINIHGKDDYINMLNI